MTRGRLRILMVSDVYPPVVGGLERHVQTLSKELVRRGHQVDVATLWHEGSPRFELDEGVRVHRIKGWNRVLRPFYQDAQRMFHPTAPDPGVTAALGSLVAGTRPDIVHAHSWMMYSYLPLKRWFGARLIVTLHDYCLACARKDLMHEGLHICSGPAYAKCLRCTRGCYGLGKGLLLTTGLAVESHFHAGVDRYVAISRAVARASALAAGGIGIEIIPTLIPDHVVDAVGEAERPAFAPPGDYILFVGKLGRHKGVGVLLDAYREMSCDVPLVMLGLSAPDTPATFPPGVKVVYNVPHPLVMAAWQHCTIGVVPSIWPEPFSQAALEAMACGRAVIGTTVGGLQDAIIDGETGILVPPDDVSSLRNALTRLLQDPGFRMRLGAGGRIRAREFRASSVTDRIEQLYVETLRKMDEMKQVQSPSNLCGN